LFGQIRPVAAETATAVPTLDGRELNMEHRGIDVLDVGGRRVSLQRYRVRGVIWGAETAWFEEDRRLVALATNNAEYEPLLAVHDGYEPAVPALLSRAARDAVEDLIRLKQRLSRRRTGPLAIVGGRLVDGTKAP